MTYAGWERRHRVTTVAPGKLDLFVLTLVEGKRGHIDPVTDYEAALERARVFHHQHPSQIKVLPMTGPELCNYLGLSPPEHPHPVDAAMQQEMVDTLLRVTRESNDSDARADALDLLTELGKVAG